MSASTRNFDFWIKFAIKRRNRMRDHHRWILHIWVRLSTKFQLKLTIFIFWTKLTQKEYFQSKRDVMKTTTELSIFKLVYNHGQNTWDSSTIVCKKYWKNYANQQKAVTTSETLTEYTMRSCTTIVCNKCRL